MAAKKKANKPKLLVECYGLFWQEENVFWGDPGTRGKLVGHVKGHKKQTADFREQTGIYVLYADYKVLYVGQAGFGQAKLFNRLKSHLDDSLAGRWDRFSWFGFRRVLSNGTLAKTTEAKHPTTNVILNQMEAILITSTEPPLNRQGGRWGHAKQYLQVKDGVLYPTTRHMTEDLWDWMEEQKKATVKRRTRSLSK